MCKAKHTPIHVLWKWNKTVWCLKRLFLLILWTETQETAIFIFKCSYYFLFVFYYLFEAIQFYYDILLCGVLVSLVMEAKRSCLLYHFFVIAEYLLELCRAWISEISCQPYTPLSAYGLICYCWQPTVICGLYEF